MAVKQTAGRDALGEFAPKFAELNDEVLFGQVWSRDMADILQKMIDADVIVLASPVYFYSISAQLKAVIDRTVARWLEVKDKEFYYITTMADEEKASADTTLTCFRGYADCVEGAVEKGVLVASGVYEPGAVRNTSAMAQAYEMGRNV